MVLLPEAFPRISWHPGQTKRTSGCSTRSRNSAGMTTQFTQTVRGHIEHSYKAPPSQQKRQYLYKSVSYNTERATEFRKLTMLCSEGLGTTLPLDGNALDCKVLMTFVPAWLASFLRCGSVPRFAGPPVVFLQVCFVRVIDSDGVNEG